jgi:putative ABC transport system ATP-binding protein
MIQIACLNKTYTNRNREDVVALKDFNFTAKEKDFVVLKGESGAGKSTLLFIISGMLKPDSGEVIVCGENVTQLSENQKSNLREQSIGYVFQSFHLIPYLTVKENIKLGIVRGKAEVNKIEEICEHLNIASKFNCLASELSAGEKQRVALARAMIKSPRIILADEPTGNLDQTNTKIIVKALKRFAQRGGVVVMVTHSDCADEYATKEIQVTKSTN